jgi:hypothetical protein
MPEAFRHFGRQDHGVPVAVLAYAELSTMVQAYMERRYGIRVALAPVGGSFVGDLDGAEIRIDPAASGEQRLFLLGHLFGHTVQWNTDPAAFELGQPQAPPVPESLLPALLAYEREAASYGLTLFEEAGAGAVDPWYSNYSACDLDYLMHFYRTGEKSEFRAFWREGRPLLPAKAIPEFQPVRRVFRAGGVVI